MTWKFLNTVFMMLIKKVNRCNCLVNENIKSEIKMLGEGKRLKKFYSNNTIDLKKIDKSENLNKEAENKFKKDETKARSKTPLSRNNQTKSSVNVNEMRGKSIKPQTERGKNLNNVTTDPDHFKSERPSPKVIYN